MADLLIHYTAAHVLGKPLPTLRHRVIFYVGACVPDFLFKAFYFLTASSTWYAEPTHAPLMLVGVSYVLSFLFESATRKAAFWLLLAGSLTHVLIDMGKDYMGVGVILWAYPFSMDLVELGWYLPDDTLVAWPWCFAAIAGVEGGAWAVRMSREKSKIQKPKSQ